MGVAMEIISGKATNPSAYTALTMSTGDSASIRNFNPGATAQLVDFWGLGATKGSIRIRSPRLHDNVQGIKAPFGAANPVPLMTGYHRENLYAQDNLTLEIIDTGTETDMASFLMYYSDLPGSQARLYSWAEILPRVVHLSGCEVDLTTGGTAGDYGGAAAINTTFDQFKANTDYAILGYSTDTAVLSVGIRSADFGNLRIGGPGTNNKIETRDWFVRLNQTLNLPTVPVFNAANKAGTLVDLVHNATSTAVVVTFLCAQLS
jgi:hypothetical protein